MCGVIGLVHEKHRADLGRIAGELLRTLEYRGYDSTGAAIQGDGPEVDLRKDVGAPSQMIGQLGIDRLSGRVLCAQVRWATFGAVDQTNAQPHVVRCKTYVYGAHNGNVTNCDQLKAWLQAEGHDVRSDNDGEMVVHTIEHFFARALEALGTENTAPAARRSAMRQAISEAAKMLRGSYAAVIVDPLTHTFWGIKKGSSFYFGVGESDGSKFGVTSSDLSSVLKLTRVLVPLSEGEYVEVEAGRWKAYRVSDGAALEKKPVRSRLRAQDTALLPPFSTFMEQEIHAQIEATRQVVRAFLPEPEEQQRLGSAVDQLEPAVRAEVLAAFDRARDQVTDAALSAELRVMMRLPSVAALVESRPEVKAAPSVERLRSSESGLIADLWSMLDGPAEQAAMLLLDAHLAREERRELEHSVDGFCDRVRAAEARGGRIFVVCCGSSFHAAKTAALFFNALAGIEILPLLPGEFRGQYGRNLRDGDLFIGVSQSGETKDLIDVLDEVVTSGKEIQIVSLVNNVNSTLAQEKSHLVVPLRCGPEVAVAATKSFVNQLAVFYGLALETGRRGPGGAALEERYRRLTEIPELIERTLRDTDQALEQAAELLFLRPSIHLLAIRLLGVAREGALKIREVVLNHTEGFEGSEFKHGPNTILGFNTLFGLDQLERLLQHWRAAPPPSVAEALKVMYADYPLIYVTGPDARDVDLTVSQINTHKIRGASTLIIAEEDPALLGAASKAPADNAGYQWSFVALPATGDPLLTAFTATVALQRLALKMSLKKKAHLDALGVLLHGVHPDVPKNVSKSITVD